MDKLVFDLETKQAFDEVGGKEYMDRLGMSLGVVYDYGTGLYTTYFEPDAAALAEKLLSAELVIGFNLLKFDYVVLQPYTPHDLRKINTLDILATTSALLGFRVSLQSFAQATLGVGKTADGLQSVAWYKAGMMNKIEEYCRKDVDLTRQLYEFGTINGRIYFIEKRSGRRREVPAYW